MGQSIGHAPPRNRRPYLWFANKGTQKKGAQRVRTRTSSGSLLVEVIIRGRVRMGAIGVCRVCREARSTLEFDSIAEYGDTQTGLAVAGAFHDAHEPCGLKEYGAELAKVLPRKAPAPFLKGERVINMWLAPCSAMMRFDAAGSHGR